MEIKVVPVRYSGDETTGHGWQITLDGKLQPFVYADKREAERQAEQCRIALQRIDGGYA